MPYLEVVANGTDFVGNDRYEGFVKDLMDNIARVKNFTYKLVLVPDNHYGNHDPLTGKWSGMIGEILEGVKKCDSLKLMHTNFIFSTFSES